MQSFLTVILFYVVGCACGGHGSEEKTHHRYIEARLVSYQRCEFDTDCRENSFCFGNDQNKIGRCKCNNGYELLSRNRTYYACLKFVNWGEECVQDNQCFESLGVYAVCDKTCKCGQRAHRYEEEKCYETVLLDDLCKTDANCLLSDGTFGFCVAGRCSCDLLKRPAPDKRSCILDRRPGEACSSDEECAGVADTVCRDGICTCAMGYIISKDMDTCLRVATYFGEPCVESKQCDQFLEESVCNNNTCICSEGYHGFGSKCVKSARTGEFCRDREQCVLNQSYEHQVDCINGVCQCLPGVTNEIYGCSSSNNKNVISALVVFLVFCLFLSF